jgi:hypothetical protein
MKYIVYLIMSALLTSCILEPSGDQRLKIINNTGCAISVHYDPSTVPKYPSINHTDIYIRDSVAKNDTLALSTYDLKPWPQVIQRGNRKLNLFIYDVDSLKKYSVDTLIKRKMYRRIQKTHNELEITNWVIQVQ